MAYRDKYRGTNGRMGDNRVAWCKTVIGVFEVKQFLPSEEEGVDLYEGTPLADTQVGPNVRLLVSPPYGRKPVTLNLTACTANELKAIRQILNLAIDLAEPVVAERDEVAQNAAREGNDSYARVYRQVPEVVVRKGKLATHHQGVWVRSENVPQGPGGRGSDSSGDPDGTRGAGPGVAVEEPEVPGTTDDRPETD